MAEILVNRIQMEVPDSITTEMLLQESQAEPGDFLYHLEPDGNQRVLASGQQVEVEDGDRFGTISRFRTGGG